MTVGFSETDFSGVEGATLDVVVTVTGNQENGDIEFQVTALTVQQFQDQAPTCNVGIGTLSGSASADCKSLSLMPAHTHTTCMMI